MSNDMLNKQLFKAVEEDRIADIAPLIKQGADVNAIDNKSGMTLLMISCLKMSTLTTVELLLNGADPNIKTNDSKTMDNYDLFHGTTALEIMMINHYLDIITFTSCLDTMKYSDIYNDSKEIEIHDIQIHIITLLIKYGAKINISNMLGQSPLMYACMSGNKEMVRFLISCGADVNQRDITGATPLLRTIIKEKIKSLVDNYKLDTEVDIVKILLESGADIDVRDIFGANAVIDACIENKDKILRLLLKAGANPNSKIIPNKLNRYNNSTAIIVACMEGHKEIVETLIKAGADVNATDKFGTSALYTAVFNERPDIVQLLITAGAHDDDIHDEQSMKMAKMVAEHIGSLSEEEKQRYITDPNTSIRKLRIFLMIFAIIVSIFCLLGK